MQGGGMGWAANYIKALKNGELVKFRPRGSSMVGKIESGQLCTIEPIAPGDDICVGDIVLCKVMGREYLHLINAVRPDRFQIANAKGHINGWTNRTNIFGKCTRIED
jgi:hypothetical protein